MAWYDGIKIIEKGIDLVLLILNRKRSKPSNVFGDSVAIGIISNDILKGKDLSIDCFLILMAHNGGGKMKPLGLKYRSVVGGSYKEWLMPDFDMESYRNLPMDYEYEKLLNNVFNDREYNVGIEIDTVKAKGTVRNKMKFENLKFAKYYYLHSSKDGMWYVMIGTTAVNERLDDDMHNHYLFLAINKIKQIIKKY